MHYGRGVLRIKDHSVNDGDMARDWHSLLGPLYVADSMEQKGCCRVRSRAEMMFQLKHCLFQSSYIAHHSMLGQSNHKHDSGRTTSFPVLGSLFTWPQLYMRGFTDPWPMSSGLLVACGETNNK